MKKPPAVISKIKTPGWILACRAFMQSRSLSLMVGTAIVAVLTGLMLSSPHIRGSLLPGVFQKEAVIYIAVSDTVTRNTLRPIAARSNQVLGARSSASDACPAPADALKAKLQELSQADSDYRSNLFQLGVKGDKKAVTAETARYEARKQAIETKYQSLLACQN